MTPDVLEYRYRKTGKTTEMFEKFKEVLNTHGAGVFLPVEKYEKLTAELKKAKADIIERNTIIDTISKERNRLMGYPNPILTELKQLRLDFQGFCVKSTNDGQELIIKPLNMIKNDIRKIPQPLKQLKKWIDEKIIPNGRLMVPHPFDAVLKKIEELGG
jgi:hypothetical protein